MARLSLVSLRLAFVVVAVVLISARESDSHLKSTTGSFGIARAFAATAPTPDPKNDVAATLRLSSSYGKLPISFEINHGQTDGRVRFLARGTGYNVFLTSSEVVLALHRSHGDDRQAHRLPSSMQRRTAAGISESTVETAAVRMRLIGSDPSARVEGMDALPGKVNYLIGNDPRKWHVDVPTYAKVRFAEIYRGIDMVYYGNEEGQLEHDFIVKPGADPGRITFNLRIGDRRAVLMNGNLINHTALGDVLLHAPTAYQVVSGQRQIVNVGYLADDVGNIRLRVGLYDKKLPMVIDPVLVFSAVFGGSGNDLLGAIAVDGGRNIYVAGETWSLDFPMVDAYQPTTSGLSDLEGAMYISKLNPSGTTLLYSTYLGRSQPSAILVDTSGRIYVSGENTGDLAVVHAHQPTYGGGLSDAFVAVLNPAGNVLEWSTYLGGPQGDSSSGMALDPLGNVYLTGFSAGQFPILHSVRPSGPARGAWVAKFSSAGVLQYSSILYDLAAEKFSTTTAIAIDSDSSAYVTGYATGPVFTTPGALQSPCTDECAWAAKLSPAGDTLLYSTLFGVYSTSSAGTAEGFAIAVDSDHNAYVAGAAGPGLPVSSSAFQRTYGGGLADGFVVKLNATGSRLIWATYLGGSDYDYITDMAIDQYRQLYVSGYTYSSNFPLRASLESYSGNSAQSFVTTLSGSLSFIPYYSTLFGKPEMNPNYRIAVDPALNVYIAGSDTNGVYPTPGAFSKGSQYMTDTLSKISVSKLTIMDDLAVALSASPTPVPHGSNLTYTIGVTSKGPDFGVNVRLSDTLPAGTTFVSYDAGGGTCTAPPVGSTGTLNCGLAQLNSGATWYVKLTVNVGATSGTTLSNMAATISNMQDFVTSNNSATITTRVN